MARRMNSLVDQQNVVRNLEPVPHRPGMLTAYEQLKPLERIFTRAYVATDDPIKAILAVSPELKGNSLANVRALDYMRRPLVQAAIAEEFKRIADRYEITAENVVQEIGLIAFARMGDFATPSEDGDYLELDLNKIPEHELSARLAAVSEFSLDETESDGKVTRKFKFKLHDKNSGLDKLMKRFGLYAPEKLQIDSRNVNLNIDGGTVKEDMTVDQAKRLWEQELEE